MSVMLGGNQSAIFGNLKQVIGSRNIQMAAPDVVKKTTGYDVGSIPPFCWQTHGFQSFIELSLLNESNLGVGTGLLGYEIPLTPGNLIKATNAIVANLTNRDEAVF